MEVENTVSYYDMATLTAVKSFREQAPLAHNPLKLFTAIICEFL